MSSILLPDSMVEFKGIWNTWFDTPAWIQGTLAGSLSVHRSKIPSCGLDLAHLSKKYWVLGYIGDYDHWGIVQDPDNFNHDSNHSEFHGMRAIPNNWVIFTRSNF